MLPRRRLHSQLTHSSVMGSNHCEGQAGELPPPTHSSGKKPTRSQHFALIHNKVHASGKSEFKMLGTRNIEEREKLIVTRNQNQGSRLEPPTKPEADLGDHQRLFSEITSFRFTFIL